MSNAKLDIAHKYGEGGVGVDILLMEFLNFNLLQME